MSEFSLARGTGQDQTVASTALILQLRRSIRNLVCSGLGAEFHSELVQTGWFGVSNRSLAGKGRVN